MLPWILWQKKLISCWSNSGIKVRDIFGELDEEFAVQSVGVIDPHALYSFLYRFGTIPLRRLS